jgi:hypothetical protein
MTAVHVFSSVLVAVSIRNKAALTVAEALYQNAFCVFGTARRIKTDLGREYETELLSRLCSVFGNKKLRTSAYHASANGRVDRSHRTLNSIIAKIALALSTVLRTTSLSYGNMPFSGTHSNKNPFTHRSETLHS